jgi:hypothetical protein
MIAQQYCAGSRASRKDVAHLEHGFTVNSDSCLLCGKSGLQLMQEGYPPCSIADREAYAHKRALDEWRQQALEMR